MEFGMESGMNSGTTGIQYAMKFPDNRIELNLMLVHRI